MKQGIHPEYVTCHVHCACGNDFQTRATKDEIHVEICSECHPFYTGKQKLIDTGGRVDRFRRREEKTAAMNKAAKSAKKK
jgi:large subunit ribosomal protein L31